MLDACPGHSWGGWGGHVRCWGLSWFQPFLLLAWGPSCAGTELCLAIREAAHSRVHDKCLHNPLLASSCWQSLLSFSSWYYFLPLFAVSCIFINIDSYGILLRADQPVFGKMVLQTKSRSCASVCSLLSRVTLSSCRKDTAVLPVPLSVQEVPFIRDCHRQEQSVLLKLSIWSYFCIY